MDEDAVADDGKTGEGLKEGDETRAAGVAEFVAQSKGEGDQQQAEADEVEPLARPREVNSRAEMVSRSG